MLTSAGSLVRWLGLTLFLLSLAGAASSSRARSSARAARGRREVAFRRSSVPFSVGLLFEAALYAANGLDQVQGALRVRHSAARPDAFGST